MGPEGNIWTTKDILWLARSWENAAMIIPHSGQWVLGAMLYSLCDSFLRGRRSWALEHLKGVDHDALSLLLVAEVVSAVEAPPEDKSVLFRSLVNLGFGQPLEAMRILQKVRTELRQMGLRLA